jgi:hypothetical protein
MKQPGPGDTPSVASAAPVSAPRPVVFAVRLMYAGAALSAAGLITSLLLTRGLRAAIIAASKGHHLSAAQVTAREHAIIGSAIISGLVGIGLWLLMAWANGRGQSWARIVATVLCAINTLGLVFSLTVAHTAAGLLLTIAIWLAGVGAVILLWQRESSSYFAATPLGTGAVGPGRRLPRSGGGGGGVARG